MTWHHQATWILYFIWKWMSQSNWIQIQSSRSDIYLPGDFRALCASVRWQAFLIQKHLGPVHNTKTTSNPCTDRGITGLTWPANWSDLNPTENLRCIVKEDETPNQPQILAKGLYQSKPGFQLHLNSIQ